MTTNRDKLKMVSKRLKLILEKEGVSAQFTLVNDFGSALDFYAHKSTGIEVGDNTLAVDLDLVDFNNKEEFRMTLERCINVLAHMENYSVEVHNITKGLREGVIKSFGLTVTENENVKVKKLH